MHYWSYFHFFASGRSQTNQANSTPAATDPDGEDQGATDEVITYGDEGENEGEMEMGTVVGMGGNGDIITQSSDLMADIKNSLVNETNANNNLEVLLIPCNNDNKTALIVIKYLSPVVSLNFISNYLK